MTPTLAKSVSPLQLRDELETMVLKELLGPGSAEEEIIESPGTRYFVGVLAPRKRAKAGAAPAKAAVAPPMPASRSWSPIDELASATEIAVVKYRVLGVVTCAPPSESRLRCSPFATATPSRLAGIVC